MPSTTFKRLQISGWRQFDNVDLELHDRLTVLTGANGAGKSTLLHIFSHHTVPRGFLATPKYDKSGAYVYLSGLFSSIFGSVANNSDGVGRLAYSNGSTAQLRVPAQTSAQYQITLSNQQLVDGVHFESHQPVAGYQILDRIPTNLISAEQAYASYFAEMNNRYIGNHTQFSPMYRMKESLISMATFGEGNRYVQGNKPILESFTGFIALLRNFLPNSIGFRDIAIRPPEIVLVTDTGEFLLDASSGGLMALVDIAWRIFMYSRHHTRFVVTIDEPENHLHPSLQRVLMPSLLKAFPEVQFIIATHSPFMVSSVKDSNVFVLRYIDDNRQVTGEGAPRSRVISEKLDTINKAGNASEILREVLGVPATIPEWVATGLAEIIGKYRSQPITAESIEALRAELKQLGYGELFPEAISEIAAGQ